MKTLFSDNTFYTFILLFLPMLIVTSWLNSFTGTLNYSAGNYLLMFIVPAIVMAYGVAFLSGDYLHEAYGFTYVRVLFTLIGLIFCLYLFSYVLSFFGFNAIFLTVHYPLTPRGVSPPPADISEIAGKYYSFQLLYAMTFIVILYSVAAYLFKGKKKNSGKLLPF